MGCFYLRKYLNFEIPWKTIIVLLWGAIFFKDELEQLYDDLTTPQPWFHAEIDILPTGQIEYERRINRWLHGSWVATVSVIQDEGWHGICTGDGVYTYTPDRSGTTVMPFSYFTGGCPKPDEFTQVCVRFRLANFEGRTQGFGPFCAEEMTDEF